MHDPAPTDRSADRDAAERVARTLCDHGHIAYFAGGCVRDELLGRRPKDYDVATDATPDRVQSLFARTAHVGAHFGVTLVRDRQTVIEVATFRADGEYDDSRHPNQVVFSDPPTDAQRRDFTINALFLDPFAPGDGVIDFVNGRDDLDARIIRAVGDPDARLAEDHLRALRAVRFSATLSFEIDPATAQAISTHARELAGVSRERIGDELRRMLELPTRADAIRTLETLGLDAPVLESTPKQSALGPMRELAPNASPALAIASWMLARADPPGLAAFAGPLAPHTAPRTIEAWRRALCLTNDERDHLTGIIDAARCLSAAPDAPGAWHTLAVAGRKRLAAGKAFSDAQSLLGTLAPGRASTIEIDVRTLIATPSGLAPSPLIDGADLIGLGWPPGPTFGRVLRAVYDAQLEDRISTPEAALELARTLGVQ